MKYTAAFRRMPPPQAACAQYFAMDTEEDVGEAPAAERPPPLREVGPQPGDIRHGGIGYELVLSTTVPRVMEDEAWDLGVLIFLEAMKEEADEKEEKETGKEKQKGGAQVNLPRWISERIMELFAPVPKVIPPRRISERIQQQNVAVPEQCTPQKRISERIEELTVEVPGQVIPQKRIPKRTAEQIIDV